jgi:hypothetical protein
MFLCPSLGNVVAFHYTWIVLCKAAMLPHAALGEVNASNLHIVQGEGEEVRGPLSLIQTRIYVAAINYCNY